MRLFFGLLAVALISAKCSDNASSDKSIIDNSYLEREELGDLIDNNIALLANAELVGTWQPAKPPSDGFKYVTFSSDAKGESLWANSVEDPISFSWKLDGNILISRSEEQSQIRSKKPCMVTEQEMTTAAVVNNALYLEPLIRIAGTNGYNGTWKQTAGEIQETYFDDNDDYIIEIGYITIALTITDTTFTGTYRETVSMSGITNGDIIDYADDIPKQLQGTVAKEGELLVLRTDDQKAIYSLKLISDNVMLLMEGEHLEQDMDWNSETLFLQ